jgi:uncharacterized protein
MGKFNKKKSDISIPLGEVGESGYRLSCSKCKEWIRDAVRDVGNSDFTFLDDIKIQIDVFRLGKEFSARGVISTALTLRCVKCLDDFAFPLEAQFHYTLCPSDRGAFLPEMEVRRDDLDVVHYKGTDLDLVPLLVEQIILTIPTYPLCGETCKGICQRCGGNLNNRLCQCSRENEKISVFEVLKNFPLKQKS